MTIFVVASFYTHFSMSVELMTLALSLSQIKYFYAAFSCRFARNRAQHEKKECI